MRPLIAILTASIGAVAGLRSMTAPAMLAYASNRKILRLRNAPIMEIVSRQAADKLLKLALAELIADKMPFTADRIKPGALATRILSGAACGALLSTAGGGAMREGAALGGLGALLSTFAGYHLRRRLSRNFPRLAVAVAEDLLAITASAAIIAYAGEGRERNGSLQALP
jgi:uncharacterized membrane protein